MPRHAHPHPKTYDQGALAVTRHGLVYIGGHFTSLAHTTRPQVGAADAATGALDGWAPGTNGSIWAMAADPTAVHLGGTFTRTAGLTRVGYARFALG